MNTLQRRMLTKALRPLVANMVVEVLEGIVQESQSKAKKKPLRRARPMAEEEDDDEDHETETDEEYDDEEMEGDLDVTQDEDGETHIRHEDDDEDEETEECGPGRMRESHRPKKSGRISALESENRMLKRGIAIRQLAERLGLSVSVATLESLSNLPPKKARAVLDDMAAAQGRPKAGNGSPWVDTFLEGVASGEGRQTTGQWPTAQSAIDQLIGG